MGTDIHISIEERHRSGQGRPWIPLVIDETVERDYQLFNYINADVRSGRVAQSIKREAMPMPHDVSKKIRDAYDNDNFHHLTVLTESEFRTWFPWSFETLEDETLGHFALLGYAYTRRWNDFYTHRFILWFDC